MKMDFIGHYSFVDDVLVCYVPIKIHLRNSSDFLLSLISEATQHDAEQVGLDSDGVPW